MRIHLFAFFAFLSLGAIPPAHLNADARPRVVIETDAGGDPDDEQSMVRFLLYTNDLDVEGIIANRPVAREKENRNARRTGLEIVQQMIDAYGQCHANLVLHDQRYPTRQQLWDRTVSGYDDSDAGVRLIINAVDRDDPRPLWFCNWGTDRGSAPSSLLRALDQVRKERGPAGYATFKSKLRLSSSNQFGDHTTSIDPPFPLWVDTFRPEIDRKRWYHRFSGITAKAGGFDIHRDVLKDHGPLGALYPLNTTHPQKEGDTPTFLYLIPNGLNAPEHPTWGSWAGRYGPMDGFEGKNYYWANQVDQWNGTTDRDNTLARWAAHLQNDFAARMDWCVQPFEKANHPPVVQLDGSSERTVQSGESIVIVATASDPDNNPLKFQWIHYREASGYSGPEIDLTNATSPKITLVAPKVTSPTALHLILIVTDAGTPPLTRYVRAIVHVRP